METTWRNILLVRVKFSFFHSDLCAVSPVVPYLHSNNFTKKRFFEKNTNLIYHTRYWINVNKLSSLHYSLIESLHLKLIVRQMGRTNWEFADKTKCHDKSVEFAKSLELFQTWDNEPILITYNHYYLMWISKRLFRLQIICLVNLVTFKQVEWEYWQMNSFIFTPARHFSILEVTDYVATL